MPLNVPNFGKLYYWIKLVCLFCTWVEHSNDHPFKLRGLYTAAQKNGKQICKLFSLLSCLYRVRVHMHVKRWQKAVVWPWVDLCSWEKANICLMRTTCLTLKFNLLTLNSVQLRFSCTSIICVNIMKIERFVQNVYVKPCFLAQLYVWHWHWTLWPENYISLII